MKTSSARVSSTRNRPCNSIAVFNVLANSKTMDFSNSPCFPAAPTSTPPWPDRSRLAASPRRRQRAGAPRRRRRRRSGLFSCGARAIRRRFFEFSGVYWREVDFQPRARRARNALGAQNLGGRVSSITILERPGANSTKRLILSATMARRRFLRRPPPARHRIERERHLRQSTMIRSGSATPKVSTRMVPRVRITNGFRFRAGRRARDGLPRPAKATRS